MYRLTLSKMLPRRYACQFGHFKKRPKNSAILEVDGRFPVNELFILPNHFRGLKLFFEIFQNDQIEKHSIWGAFCMMLDDTFIGMKLT